VTPICFSTAKIQTRRLVTVVVDRNLAMRKGDRTRVDIPSVITNGKLVRGPGSIAGGPGREKRQKPLAVMGAKKSKPWV